MKRYYLLLIFILTSCKNSEIVFQVSGLTFFVIAFAILIIGFVGIFNDCKIKRKK
jgi:hypothetical protein